MRFYPKRFIIFLLKESSTMILKLDLPPSMLPSFDLAVALDMLLALFDA